MIVNPNGITFGVGSKVSAASIIGSVLDNHAGIITPKTLTLAAIAANKVYDGTVSSAYVLRALGLALGDTVSNLAEEYDTPAIGTNKLLTVKAGYVVNDGNSGNNYSVVTKQ